MHITKIKLSDYGIKGMEVQYIKPETKDNLVFENEYTTKYHHPVPLPLREAISNLKHHIIAINGLNKKSELTITYVKRDGLGFKFGAKLRVLEKYFVNVEIPYLTEHCEDIDFDAINQEISNIFSQVKDYIDNSASHVIDNKQLVLDFMNVNKDKGKEMIFDLDNMSEQEIQEQALKILENAGCIVMRPDEMEVSTNDAEIVEEEPKMIEMNTTNEFNKIGNW